jgi:hypothetical protein
MTDTGKVFYALFKGKGDGCDYTIGCNIAHQKLRATTLEDAKREALNEHSLDSEYECTVERVTVLEVVGVHDLAAEIETAREAIKAQCALQEKARKRAEVARLMREIGE